MANQPGKICLMGSGELTASMVEVHKTLLRQLPASEQAVFLDTPAGFQLNVDQISARAVDYFETHVRHALKVVSYQSNEDISDYDRQQASHALGQAGFVLIGPGSPTYAVRQLQPSPVPDLLVRCVSSGGCLVAASAAALTVGRFTLPVYEIYKVGMDLHWIDGLNLLGRFGLDVVVVPHWNNAEGGTHDTRCCFMGAARFEALIDRLPQATPILGLDEHTACILDLMTDQVEVKGLGGITLRTADGVMRFHSGDRFALSVLRDGAITPDTADRPPAVTTRPLPEETDESFWNRAHDLENRFQKGLARGDVRTSTNSLLEFDRLLWQAHQGLENEAVVAQARDSLRDMIVVLGNEVAATPVLHEERLTPLVESLLRLRQKLRQEKQWLAADMLRDALKTIQVHVEDTSSGHRWYMTSNRSTD